MNRRAWLAFAALSLIWGVPYLFIKVAVDGGISPFFLAWALLALVGIELSADTGEIFGAAAVMVAALGYAAGPMLLKRHMMDFDPRATMAASLAVAAVLLTPAALLTFPQSTPPSDALASILVL